MTDVDRKLYKTTIEQMRELCPEMMSRKIIEANVQQAYIFNMVASILSDYPDDEKILCVGSFEDTACESLKVSGKHIIEIDPDVNGQTLDTFYSHTSDHFNIIFSTSVLEHVKDDELFIKQLCDLLNPGGYAILTVDFKDSYKQGDPLHATAVRYYTKHDLEVRLPKVLKECSCSLVGETNYDGEPDFVYQGHLYSLATFMFRKDSNV